MDMLTVEEWKYLEVLATQGRADVERSFAEVEEEAPATTLEAFDEVLRVAKLSRARETILAMRSDERRH